MEASMETENFGTTATTQVKHDGGFVLGGIRGSGKKWSRSECIDTQLNFP
jgi:hypothetical protein